MAVIRSLGAYGANINAGINVNADHGWGGYQWPAGVPSNLLGVARYGDIVVTVRKELVPLFVLAFRIMAEKHGYKVWTQNPNGNGEAWGPWSYENRKISGSNTASNHSKGKAIDVNAPYNPYSVSNFQSDFPPAMVADLESIGLGWGGRYGDTMHFEYIYSPADVAGHVAKAQALLGGKAVGTVDKPAVISNDDNAEDEDGMGNRSDQEIKQLIRDGVKWALEDPNVDPTIVRAVVQQEVAKALAGRYAPADRQAFKQDVHDGAAWALEDPNVNKG